MAETSSSAEITWAWPAHGVSRLLAKSEGRLGDGQGRTRAAGVCLCVKPAKNGVGGLLVEPGVQFGAFRFLGLNVLWVPEILIFHAVVTTTVAILVIRSLWPERVSKSFLQRRHYMALAVLLGVAIVLTNVILVPFVAKNMGYAPPFDPLPYIVLLLLSLFIVIVVRMSLSQRRAESERDVFRYALLGGALLLLLTLGSHVTLAIFGAWITGGAVVLAGCLFYWYFMSLDFDPEIYGGKNSSLSIPPSYLWF